jgi:hypothetical protein
MFKKILPLFFVLIIYIFLYFHIANLRKINIRHPVVVHEPNFELKFKEVPYGLKTVFSYPDIMRNVKITKLSMYYTVWKYSMVFSDVNKLKKSVIGIVDSSGNQLPPNIYHSSIILEESDDSEFIYRIDLCFDSGINIRRKSRNECLCSNPKLNYIKPSNVKEEKTFLMIQPVKLKSISIIELMSFIIYRLGDGNSEKMIDKIYRYHSFKFNCQMFICEALISIIDYIEEESDKEKVLTVANNCIQDAPVALKSFLGWKEYIFSNTFIINQLNKFFEYINF